MARETTFAEDFQSELDAADAVEDVERGLSGLGDADTGEAETHDAKGDGDAGEADADADGDGEDGASFADDLAKAWNEAKEDEGKPDAERDPAAAPVDPLDNASTPWLDEMLEPHTTGMSEAGLSKKGAVERLFAVEQHLREDPGAALVNLVQMYATTPARRQQAVAQLAHAMGIDPAGGGGGQHGGGDVDARINAAFQQREQDAQHATQRQAMQEATVNVEQFATAKDAGGRLRFPDFLQLRGTMGSLMLGAANIGRPMDLPTAYRQAHAAHNADELLANKNAQQRRADDEKAKAAQTPRTASRRVAASDDSDDDVSFADSLKASMRSLDARQRI